MKVHRYDILMHPFSLGLSILLFSLSLLGQSSPTMKVGLSGTLKIAEEHSPDFDSLRRNLRIAELESETASKHWVPQVNISATHGILDRDPRQGLEPWTSSLDLSLSESIYDNGESILKKKIYQKKLSLAELNLRLEREKLALNLATEFLRFSLTQKTLELQETQLALIKKQFQSASQEYFQGLKTQRDHLRFKTQVSRGEIDVLTTRNSLLKSKQELLRMMGLSPHEAGIDFQALPLLTERSITEGPLDPKSAIKFKLLEMQKFIEEQNLELARKSLYPVVTLSAGTNYTSANYLGSNASLTDNDGLSWNLLLTLSYKLFDGGTLQRSHQIEVEKSQIAKNTLQAQYLSLTSDLQQWEFQQQQVRANLKLARELQSLERKNREMIESDYRNGRAYFLDFITVLSNELDAQFKYFTAIHDSENLRFTMLSYKGELYDTLQSRTE